MNISISQPLAQSIINATLNWGIQDGKKQCEKCNTDGEDDLAKYAQIIYNQYLTGIDPEPTDEETVAKALNEAGERTIAGKKIKFQSVQKEDSHHYVVPVGDEYATLIAPLKFVMEHIDKEEATTEAKESG